MILYNYVYDYFSSSQSVDGDLDWLIIHYLGESVDYNENQVVAVAFSVNRKQ